jgi:nucleotidyltransferase substrate binding protein (TIGR01987 family)
VDRLARRFQQARRALASLYEVLKCERTEIVRDAAIKRFEYTFETAWKAAQVFLHDRHGMEVASPKAVFRAVGKTGYLTELQVVQALAMVDDRNLTVHTYNENVAEQIYLHLPGWADLIEHLLNGIEQSPQHTLPLEGDQ